MKKEKCPRCGGAVKDFHIYCVACEGEKQKKDVLQKLEQKKMKNKTSYLRCEDCGKEMKGENQRRRYCDDCRKRRGREAQKKYEQKKRQHGKKAMQPKKTPQPKKAEQIKKNGVTLAQQVVLLEKENSMRREKGMPTLTYGKWDALKRAQK